MFNTTGITKLNTQIIKLINKNEDRIHTQDMIKNY